MVTVKHLLNNNHVEKNIREAKFILSNKKGGYLFLSHLPNNSRFQGVYFLRNFNERFEMLKVIESISLVDVNITEVENNFSNITRRSNHIEEKFFMNHSDSLVYSVENFRGEAELVLDCRTMYDFDEKGRIYKIYEEDDCIIIEYTKFKDDSLREESYSGYIAIKGAKEFKKIEKWEKKVYPLEQERKAAPHELYVFKALNFQIKKSATIVFTFSNTKNGAIERAEYLHNNLLYIEKSQRNYVNNLCHDDLDLKNEETRMAYLNSVKSLDSLIQTINSDEGVYAGLPWFYHFWIRDEAISLKALMLRENYQDAKEILFRELKTMLPDGRLPAIRGKTSYLGNQLGCADSAGWLFKRFSDLIKILKQKKIFTDYLFTKDIILLKETLERSIIEMEKHYLRDGLIYNGPLETWFDTDYKGDTREGFRIEIQALYLNMLGFMKSLSKIIGDRENHKKYKRKENETAKRVKSRFFEKNTLKDGLGDHKIRPNVFLAYYIYPKLLNKRQWQKCFEAVLPKLWLEWGGISSISKNSFLFHEHYTGQDNRSYHRGDSWYYLNNIVAICLHRVNAKKFRPYVDAIRKASEDEILFNGVIGHHGEISSAAKQTSNGCVSQAWSAATFIELIKELHH